MRSVTSFCLLVLLLILDQGVFSIFARTSIDRIQSAGYLGETHNLITNDGYILTIFRVKSPYVAFTQRPVVLLMHGLASSSDVWLVSAPEDNLAFNLVDSGYDVWLGNSRGNYYGNRHTSLSLKDRKFWHFSFHKLGVIDLPNTIDYILQETGQSSLHYVGHSQGTTIMFVLLSSQPAYNKKLKTCHLLAPVAFIKYARFPILRIAGPALGNNAPLGPILADFSMPIVPLASNLVGYDRCRSSMADPEFCSSLLFATIYGGNSAYFNKTLFPELFRIHPAGFSIHQIVHYAQLYASGQFRKYDLGLEGNRLNYRSNSPPNYKLSNIAPRFPLHLYYSDDDLLASKTDVEHLSRILGKNSVSHFIDLKGFSHLDFLFAINVKDVINRPILQRINKAELQMQYNNFRSFPIK